LIVHLHPPLNTTAGQSRVKFRLIEPQTVQEVLDALAERFGPDFKQHLYDTQGRFIPAWCLFLNGKPIQLKRPENLQVQVQDQDELTFVMNIAGG
jgi:hypothetical protein